MTPPCKPPSSRPPAWNILWLGDLLEISSLPVKGSSTLILDSLEEVLVVQEDMILYSSKETAFEERRLTVNGSSNYQILVHRVPGTIKSRALTGLVTQIYWVFGLNRRVSTSVSTHDYASYGWTESTLVQLWITGNWHWYLKQEISPINGKRFTSMRWHPEQARTLFLASEGKSDRYYLYLLMARKAHWWNTDSSTKYALRFVVHRMI